MKQEEEVATGEGSLLDELANKQYESDTAALASAIDDICGPILEKTDRYTIPENIFKQNFADYIFRRHNTGDVIDPNLNKTLSALWATISGGGYNDVEVIDAMSGETLYVIPQLIAKSELKNDLDLDRFGREYTKQLNRLPVIAHNYLMANIGLVENNIAPVESTDEYILKWQTAYRLCYRDEQPAVEASAAATSTTYSDDDVELD